MWYTSLFHRDGSTVWKWSVLAGILGALVTLGAGTLSVLLSHDGLFAPHFCTLIGSDALVSIYIPRPQIDVEKGLSVDITVNGQDYHLEAQHFQPQYRPGGVNVQQILPFDTPAGDVQLRVAFTSPDGAQQTLVHTGTLELFEPNGPHCEPHVYQFFSAIYDGQFLTYDEWKQRDPHTAEEESVFDVITLDPSGVSDEAIPHEEIDDSRESGAL